MIDAGGLGLLAAFAQTARRGQIQVRELRPRDEEARRPEGAAEARKNSKRDQELQRLAKQLQGMQEALGKNGMTMAEGERRNKERRFNDLNRDFQRKRARFRLNLNQRRNEELAGVLDRANRRSARSPRPKYDIIFQGSRFTPARASTSPTR